MCALPILTRLRRLADEARGGPETVARLLFVRSALAALVVARVVLGSYRQLADTPGPLFDPVPILGFMPSMPSAGIIVALQVLGGAAAVAVVARWRPRWTFAIAWVCYLVLAGIRGSRGKVLHNDLLLLWVCVPFLLAPVQAGWPDRKPTREIGRAHV